MIMITAIWTIGSVIVGGLITFLVSRWYYISASRDLNSETKKLRNLLRIILVALEDDKMVKLTRDSTGEIIGIAHDANISGHLPSLKGRIVFDEIKKKQDT